MGIIAHQCWVEIPKHFPTVRLDEFVIMPNHVHGIIEIVDAVVGAQNFVPQQHVVPQQNTRLTPNVGVQNLEPLPRPIENKFQHIIPKSIGSIIRGYKIGVTKWCREQNNYDFAWQRNYYEHIIRDDGSLETIRLYIKNNPAKWQGDRENPINLKPLENQTSQS